MPASLRLLLWLFLSGVGTLPAALAQLPEFLVLPSQEPVPTLLDFPLVSAFDDLRGAFPWPVAEADYPLGLSPAHIRQRRIRQLAFQGTGEQVGTVRREPGDLIQGHDMHRATKAQAIPPPFAPRLAWRFRYTYNPAGQLLDAEGRQQDQPGHPRSQTAGWRVRKRYDARQRLVELDLASYNQWDQCPDTLLTQFRWRRWLTYDAAGRLRQVVERARNYAYRDPPCQPATSWTYYRLVYDARQRLTTVRRYTTADSALSDRQHLTGQLQVCYDAQGRVQQTVTLASEDQRLPFSFTTATQRVPTYVRGRLRRTTSQSFDLTFTPVDTLNLCASALRVAASPPQALPQGGGNLPRTSTQKQVYDAARRLRQETNPAKASVACFYHPRWWVEAAGDHTRLVLWQGRQRVHREIEVERQDAYDAFNHYPSPVPDLPLPSPAARYGWQPTDSAAERLLKQWRFTVTDRRFRYNAARELVELTVRESYNRQAVRLADGDSVSASLTRWLLEPAQDPHGRGLRRLLRKYPGWPYQVTERQRYEGFRYEYYAGPEPVSQEASPKK
ncbi:hypothetical protein ACFST9_00225 [Hymenobacter monticola]|uniref:RHS repeat protein n=1 Tax=Hymenobacter monticola TaxID=1705399 RepID=A0ABY4BEW2_9BACT|nr:hypothetical protein [Hymenobacter monticola]UOE36812.1 hypothetical protein MTP16_25380 [Hymenobacter monticola]